MSVMEDEMSVMENEMSVMEDEISVMEDEISVMEDEIYQKCNIGGQKSKYTSLEETALSVALTRGK